MHFIIENCLKKKERFLKRISQISDSKGTQRPGPPVGPSHGRRWRRSERPPLRRPAGGRVAETLSRRGETVARRAAANLAGKTRGEGIKRRVRDRRGEAEARGIRTGDGGAASRASGKERGLAAGAGARARGQNRRAREEGERAAPAATTTTTTADAPVESGRELDQTHHEGEGERREERIGRVRHGEHAGHYQEVGACCSTTW